MQFHKHFIDFNSIENINNIFCNKWTGRSYPEGKDIQVTLDAHFIKAGKFIEGFVDVNDEGNILRIKIRGGIIKFPFLVLDYFSTDPNIINYGRIMYKINEECTRMNGKVVGYSGERDFFVIADSELAIIEK